MDAIDVKFKFMNFSFIAGFCLKNYLKVRKYFCVSNWCSLDNPLSIKMMHKFENSSLNFSYHVFIVTKSIIGCDNLKGISQLLLLKFHIGCQDYAICSPQLFQDNYFFPLFRPSSMVIKIDGLDKRLILNISTSVYS